MNQHDFLDVWVMHSNFLLTVFVAFISGTSAYLIVANVKGRELHTKLFLLVSCIYILASTFFILFYIKVSESMLNVRTQMIEANLNWYNVAYEPQFIFPMILTIGGILMISLAAGSIWYFAHIRKANNENINS